MTEVSPPTLRQAQGKFLSPKEGDEGGAPSIKPMYIPESKRWAARQESHSHTLTGKEPMIK